MGSSAHGEPSTPANPQVYEFNDPIAPAAKVRMEVPWDPATHAVLDATGTRDADCRFDTVVLGLGPDHSVETSPRRFGPFPAGETTTVPAADFAAVGLSTVELLIDQQSTVVISGE